MTTTTTTMRSEAAAALALLLTLAACETKRIVRITPAASSEVPAATAEDDDDATTKEPTRLPDAPPPPLAPEVPQARIVDSNPKLDDEAFYPVEIYDQGQNAGVGERRILRFTFDRKMDVERKTLRLRPGDRELEGAWSEDGKRLEATVLGTDDASPLEAKTEYEVDLEELRSAADEPVGSPRVRFITAARDSFIEHACIHTLFGPFESVTAAKAGGTLASAPLASATHKQFTFVLPKATGPHEGDVRVAFSGTGMKRYALLVDGDADVAISSSDDAPAAVANSKTVDACPGIQQRFDVELTRGTTYRLKLSSARAEVKALWEAP